MIRACPDSQIVSIWKRTGTSILGFGCSRLRTHHDPSSYRVWTEIHSDCISEILNQGSSYVTWPKSDPF